MKRKAIGGIKSSISKIAKLKEVEEENGVEKEEERKKVQEERKKAEEDMQLLRAKEKQVHFNYLNMLQVWSGIEKCHVLRKLVQVSQVGGQEAWNTIWLRIWYFSCLEQGIKAFSPKGYIYRKNFEKKATFYTQALPNQLFLNKALYSLFSTHLNDNPMWKELFVTAKLFTILQTKYNLTPELIFPPYPNTEQEQDTEEVEVEETEQVMVRNNFWGWLKMTERNYRKVYFSKKTTPKVEQDPLLEFASSPIPVQ